MKHNIFRRQIERPKVYKTPLEAIYQGIIRERGANNPFNPDSPKMAKSFSEASREEREEVERWVEQYEPTWKESIYGSTN